MLPEPDAETVAVLPETALLKRSFKVTVMVEVATLFATKLVGEAAMVDEVPTDASSGMTVTVGDPAVRTVNVPPLPMADFITNVAVAAAV